jgi:PKD repeat protein
MKRICCELKVKVSTLSPTNAKLPNEGDYMKTKYKMSFVLISIIFLSTITLAAPTALDTTAKFSPKVPVAAFSASPTSGNAPLKVTFIDESTGKPTSWKWNFGDGKSSTVRNPIHTYNKAGKYIVTLTVKNLKSTNKITKYGYIIVSEPLKAPVATFTASPTSGYAPLEVVFTDSSTGTPSSWKWDFGDGTASIEKNPTHIYNKKGKYSVSLTVKNLKGKDTIKKNRYITILASLKAPIATFTASPTSGNTPLNVTFTDTSTGTPTSWNWNFGDGNTSFEQNPTHIYYTAGNYTVNLTVISTNGTNSTFTIINVLQSAFLVANFSSNVTKGYAPLSVQFNDLSENATEWNWDFRDGENSADKNPVHIYSKDGTYNVTLTVKNDNDSNTITKYSYINVDSSKVLDVVCKMKIYKITAKFTSEYKGTTYYFCNAGCKAKFDANPEKYITLPVANFSTNVSKGYSPLSVQFTDLSKNATEVRWDFDNNGIIDSTDRNPIHEYATSGTYSFNLTAVNANGTDSKLGTITVSEKTAILPVANFSSNVTKGYVPLSVQFNDLSENATEWNWDFGDSEYSADNNPVHIYSKNGTYDVTLTVKNVNGNNKITKYSYITVDSSEVVDVVCKMVIDKRTAEFTSTYNGTIYYFCMADCKAKFDANPEKYINS